MYKAIDAAGLAIAAAEAPGGAVTRDRARYAPFFEAAERYAHEHGLIVGGATATRMLLGRAPGPGDYEYELFSGRALADARALTKIFYELDPGGVGHYSNMMTRVPRKEFSISVDERQLFQVKALEIHRGARAADIIVPMSRPASFAQGSDGQPLMLLCMGPEVQLIGVYAALANPARAGEWPCLLETEERLRAAYLDGRRGLIEEVGGGGEGPPAVQKPAAALVAALTAEYVPRSGHAVVGGLAARALAAGRGCVEGGRGKDKGRGKGKGKSKDKGRGRSRGKGKGRGKGRDKGKSRDRSRATGCPPRLQLVTSNTFKEEERAVSRVAARLGYAVQSAVNEPGVPGDDRLRRMTMYVTRPGGRREPFLDVYNSGEYELVPFAGGCETADTASGAPVATPFVVMRFLLVDAWTIQLLFRMGVTPGPYTRQVLHDLLSDYERAAAAYLSLREAGQFEEILPPGANSYVGTYADPILHQKRQHLRQQRAGKKKRRFYPPYYPARDAARE